MKHPANTLKKYMMTGFLLLIFSFALAAANTEEVLSQKILLENTIHQRVSDAVYRVLRNENFIVNVNVDMEVVPSQEYTTVYETPTEAAEEEGTLRSQGTPAGLPVDESAVAADPKARGTQTKKVLKKRPIETGIPSDIPGFPGIQKPGFELYEEEIEVPVEEGVVYAEADDPRLAAPDTTQEEVDVESPADMDVREEDIEGRRLGEEAASASIEYGEMTPPRLKQHQVRSTSAPTYRVRNMELTIILEDPVTPQVIENIRTVAMVAAHFNRERGDELKVMTAAFQGGEGEPEADAEELLLKSIAEKMTAIEARQREAEENRKVEELKAEQERLTRDQQAQQEQDTELRKLRELEEARISQREEELKQLREEEERRQLQREEEMRTLREAEEQRLAEERRRIFEAQQQQARERLRQDSLRLALLTEQLSDLKSQLSAVDLEEEQRLKIELEQKRREAEREALEEQQHQLKSRLQELEEAKLKASVQPASFMDSNLAFLIIGAAALVAFAIALAVLMSGRRRAAALAAMPPLEPVDVLEPEPEPEPEPEMEEEPEPEPEFEEESEADQMVASATAERKLKDEVDSIKKSVVSMAVSKPGSASNIIKEWLQDTGIEESDEEAGEGEETEEAVVEEAAVANGKGGK